MLTSKKRLYELSCEKKSDVRIVEFKEDRYDPFLPTQVTLYISLIMLRNINKEVKR